MVQICSLLLPPRPPLFCQLLGDATLELVESCSEFSCSEYQFPSDFSFEPDELHQRFGDGVLINFSFPEGASMVKTLNDGFFKVINSEINFTFIFKIGGVKIKIQLCLEMFPVALVKISF